MEEIMQIYFLSTSSELRMSIRVLRDIHSGETVLEGKKSTGLTIDAMRRVILLVTQNVENNSTSCDNLQLPGNLLQEKDSIELRLQRWRDLSLVWSL